MTYYLIYHANAVLGLSPNTLAEVAAETLNPNLESIEVFKKLVAHLRSVAVAPYYHSPPRQGTVRHWCILVHP